jgi:hypothetical protein
MVIAQMNGVESAALAQTALADVVRLRRSDGQEVIVAWARTAAPTQIQIKATGEQAQFIDQYGKIMTMRPFDGNYTLALPGAVCNRVDGCPVGGLVSLLVQDVGAESVDELSAAGVTPLRFE